MNITKGETERKDSTRMFGSPSTRRTSWLLSPLTRLWPDSNALKRVSEFAIWSQFNSSTKGTPSTWKSGFFL